MEVIDYFIAKGFSSIDDIYSNSEVDRIVNEIGKAKTNRDTFRKSVDLFAIRQFLKEIPSVTEIILNEKLRDILNSVLGDNYFVVKSIYFDKPKMSNWYVAYHQDLTISVDKKLQLEGFDLWTTKQNQFAVQPPLDVLESILTVRIHLDDTNERNGSLKVVPGSHSKGIYRPENIDWSTETEVNCNVSKGGVMLMRPLLLHSSGRTTNDKQRRVIHIEFSNVELPEQLCWAERIDVN